MEFLPPYAHTSTLSYLIKGIRGFKDILPGEVSTWQWVEQKAREIFHLYGYLEIRTPALEKLELFIRGVGADTDIVQKEMYIIPDPREGDMALRPEGTAPVMRAYVEHQIYARGDKDRPYKVYYIGPMFRHERPQAGRFRQFHQIGAEVLGVEDPLVDAEVLALLRDFLTGVGVQDFQLQLNSVGCTNCRPAYREELKKYLKEHLNELCENCRARYERNPLRVLDCKNPTCREVVLQAPLLRDFYCSTCKDHLQKLENLLQALNITYLINPRLVRGLDYYMRTAFEIVSSKLGAQNAIVGGGRYDGLSQDIGGPPVPGIGFAMGIERLISLLEIRPEGYVPDVFIAALGKEAKQEAFLLQNQLRSAEITAEIEYQEDRSLKSQLRTADKLKAHFVIMIGEDELKTGELTVKNMQEGTQEQIKREEIILHLKKKKITQGSFLP
jgi:histidyl-tRNA synthetase